MDLGLVAAQKAQNLPAIFDEIMRRRERARRCAGEALRNRTGMDQIFRCVQLAAPSEARPERIPDPRDRRLRARRKCARGARGQPFRAIAARKERKRTPRAGARPFDPATDGMAVPRQILLFKPVQHRLGGHDRSRTDLHMAGSPQDG